MKTSYGKDRSEEEAEAPYAAAGLGKYVALFVLAAGAAATAYQGLGRGANGSGRSVQLQSRRSAVDDHGSDEGTETSRSATHQIPHHCRCLFIDVGLNNGDSLIQWPRAAADESRLTPAQRRGMRQCLSDIHVNSTCYVGFEANPNFNARLLDVEKALLSSGRRVRIFRETAVSTKDGTVEFMVDTQGHGLGSSVEKSKALVSLKNGQWNTDFRAASRTCTKKCWCRLSIWVAFSIPRTSDLTSSPSNWTSRVSSTSSFGTCCSTILMRSASVSCWRSSGTSE